MLDNVIIIPYRAREKNLDYFFTNTIPLLKKHLPNSKVLIVEQDWNNKFFNRGCTLNIGVKEYIGKTKYIITQDVDTNPYEETIISLYLPDINENTIKGIYTISDSLGGVIKTHIETFIKINGFPNDIWGWGAEDGALQKRANYFKINIEKNHFQKVCNHKQLDHPNFKIFPDQGDGNGFANNVPNLMKYNLNQIRDKENSIYSSGLNNLEYKVLERKNIDEFVEHIKVSI